MFLFLFPGGVQRIAILGISDSSILHTWPIYFHLLSFISEEMGHAVVLSCRSLLLTVFGQNIFKILLRHLVWKVPIAYW
jgi:hypothetical protein